MKLFCFLILFAVLAEKSTQTADLPDFEEEDNPDLTEQEKEIVAAALRGGGEGFVYDYSKTGCIGPKLWPYVYKKYCAGHRQSPINIVTKEAKKKDCPPFKYMGYNKKPKKMTIKNNGHSAVVEVEFEEDVGMPMISGGCLEGTYQFLQMHWHWGKDKTKGSEHRVNGKKYPLEAHLVHWKLAHKNVTAALTQPDGLAVLGVFLKVGKPRGRDSPYRAIRRGLKKIKDGKTGKVKEIKPPKKLEDFLPENTKKFWRYEGSLTTPSCNEVVIWTVFKSSMKIKKHHLKQFRKLKDSCGGKMVNNFRPPQPLYDRTVYTIKTGG